MSSLEGPVPTPGEYIMIWLAPSVQNRLRLRESFVLGNVDVSSLSSHLFQLIIELVSQRVFKTPYFLGGGRARHAETLRLGALDPVAAFGSEHLTTLPKCVKHDK